MAILAASIEANGWVLALTVAGTRSPSAITPTTIGTNAADAANFAAYALNPNTTPAMTLALTSTGFVQSGGVAVPSAAVARALIATKVLRRATVATPGGTRNDKTPDEADLGGGTFRVRIALSEHVYFGETGLTLTFAAGWRTGEGAGTIAVTNGSRIGSGDANLPPLPSPIVRWADVPYQRLVSTTLIPLEVVAFSHHPNGVAPVAAVRFSVTDGTNTAIAWATALASSPKYAAGGTGVATRVYRVVVDGSTATPAPLTEGLIRCDFKAFPWIGQARSSNTLDTALGVVAPSAAPSMTGLTTAGMAPAAQVPFVYAYDPTNTWTPTLYVYVEPNTWVGTGSIAANTLTVASTTSGAVAVGTKISGVGVTPGCTVVSGSAPTWTVTATGNVATIALQGGGTSNNNILTISANPATASAGVCADSLSTARNGFNALVFRTVPARNGQASSTKGTDGCIIRYKAGIYANLGATAVGAGITTNYTWEIVEGDPADSNPRANVVLNTPTSAITLRLARILLRNLTLVGPTTATSPFPTTYGWADNVEIRGASGSTGSTIPIFSGASNTFWTNTKYWQLGSYVAGQLARNCQVENQIAAITGLNNARLSTALVGSAGIGAAGSGVDAVGGSQDLIYAGNSLRFVSGQSVWLCASTSAAAAAGTASALGTSGYLVFNRQVFANNVCELYGATQPLFTTMGENVATVATYSIVEGNTLAGDRTNWLYDDLNLSTVQANDTESNIMVCNRVANNSFAWQPSKHDSFDDATVRAQRQGYTVNTSTPYGTRSKAYAVGAEIVVAGSPANVYRCITAGTTASSGGPTGTGADIIDGTVHWAWFATENRQHGYRPQAVRGWSSHYGVGYVDNITFSSGPQTEFDHEFDGLNCRNYVRETGSPGDPLFTLDRSGTGGVGAGGGNYKPRAGSPLLGRARGGNVDVDAGGVARAVPFATGAFQGDPAVALVPGGAVHTTRVSSASVGWGVVLTSASTRTATRASVAGVGWRVVLAAAPASIATRAAATVAAWAAALAPDAARSTTGSTEGRTDWSTTLALANAQLLTLAAASAIDVVPPSLLGPDAGRIRVADRTLPTLLPGSFAPPERTLTVTGDFRTVTIPADCLFPPA